jgi:hypothetical protein
MTIADVMLMNATCALVCLQIMAPSSRRTCADTPWIWSSYSDEQRAARYKMTQAKSVLNQDCGYKCASFIYRASVILLQHFSYTLPPRLSPKLSLVIGEAKSGEFRHGTHIPSESTKSSMHHSLSPPKSVSPRSSGGIIRCIVIPSILLPSIPTHQNTGTNPQSSKLVYSFCAEGESFENPQHLYKQRSVQEQKQKQKTKQAKQKQAQ